MFAGTLYVIRVIIAIIVMCSFYIIVLIVCFAGVNLRKMGNDLCCEFFFFKVFVVKCMGGVNAPENLNAFVKSLFFI